MTKFGYISYTKKEGQDPLLFESLIESEKIALKRRGVKEKNIFLEKNSDQSIFTSLCGKMGKNGSIEITHLPECAWDLNSQVQDKSQYPWYLNSQIQDKFQYSGKRFSQKLAPFHKISEKIKTYFLKLLDFFKNPIYNYFKVFY